ncbi:MAG: GNAT family N-acetyltransferase [Paracoccaceae bacterium]|nr:MAG: GNAT family N-acetyltransferase [Paracoccaceae bacterium]
MTAAAVPSLTGTPVLETDRLVLRAPGLADFDAYAGFFASARSETVGGPTPRALAWRYFGHHVGHWALRGFGSFFMAPKDGGSAVGLILAWQPEGYPEREIGWAIFTEAAEGRGLAEEGARAVLAHVFGAGGWTTAVSYIDPANTRSARLAERLGARRDTAAPTPDDDSGADVWRHLPRGAA